MRRFSWRARKTARPLVFGHRGAPTVAAENTLASFEAAAREGADGVELDVRVCRTGELVVTHDRTLERATAGADTRTVADLAWSELAKVDLGGGARIPELVDVLSFCRGARLVVNVELKRDVPDRLRAASAAAGLLRSWDPAHPLIVSSFDPPMLAAFRALAPAIPVALIVRTAWYDRFAPHAARAIGASMVNLERTTTSRALLETLHANRLAVGVWTVNDAREAIDLAALDVEALITDTPSAILAALESAPGHAVSHTATRTTA